MKIIDFEQKGNVVRFYFGNDDCTDYWGDDWDDVPYEHNAGPVYDQYVKGYVDISFNFDDKVLQPATTMDDSSQFCKDDFKQRLVPCIIVVPKAVHQGSWWDSFDRWVGADGVIKIYYGDILDPDKFPAEWNILKQENK